MFGQRSKRWSNNNINQTLGHPHCDDNYATLFVECRLCLIMQQSSIKSDNMSLKTVVENAYILQMIT